MRNEVMGSMRYQQVNGIWLPEPDEDRRHQQRLSRFATVTCGLYGWLKDTSHPIVQAGSGVMIASNLALTARHVSRGILSLDPRVDPANPPDGEFEPDVCTSVYQVPRYGRHVTWAVTNTWCSKDTDISLISIVPDSESAHFVRTNILPHAYFEWRLTPPPVGAAVEMYGFPLSVSTVFDVKSRSFNQANR